VVGGQGLQGLLCWPKPPNSESCHIQKYSDDTAVVACVCSGQEKEHRDLVESFNGWTKKNFAPEHYQDQRAGSGLQEI